MTDSPLIFIKDPSAKLDYSVDWTRWLNGDTISSSSWAVPVGISQIAISATSSVATIWLASGTAGQSYDVTNHITTAGGREDERTFTIIVRNK